MTSPLNIPEILLEIGCCIPLWSPDDTKYQMGRPSRCKKFKLHPQDLVACASVNQIWRRTMLPLLWAVYDELEMNNWNLSAEYLASHKSWYGDGAGFNNWDVPAETLEVRSVHFKYVTLYKPWPSGTLKATGIRDLTTTSIILQENMDLLRSNPQLSVLHLTCSDFGDADFDAVYPALEPVSSLQSLRLNSYLGNPSLLTRLLNNNAGLEKLRIGYIRGLTGFEGCAPLTRVTDVRLDASWLPNPGMAQLFRYTPNLHSLSFVIDDDCPLAELSKTLQRYCPQLVSIKCRTDEREVTVDEVVAMIESASHLMDFEAYPPMFTDKICRAFLAHTGWLESVNLCVSGWGRENSPPSMGRLLAHCPNLRHLIIRHGHGPEDTFCQHLGPDVQWPKEPWCCLQLENIELSGFVFPQHWSHVFCKGHSEDGPAQDENANMESVRLLPQHSKADGPFIEDILSRGWTYTAKDWDSFLLSSDLRDMRNWIFEHTRDFSQLHSVTVEGFEYLNMGRKSRMSRDK
ncbi:hypothetical protein BG003_000045 [Podila horticola]|nr:hypothetical protein BG003_000045 [Podila horticola]